MLKLRPYQEGPVRKAIEFFRQENPQPTLMVFPTAYGKSILAAEAAAACPDPILVVQPTKELLEQNLDKYRMLCGGLAPAGVYSASFGKKQIDHVTFATIGSIKNVGARFRELGFKKMLIDEAHLYPRKEESMLGQFLADSGITHVLGITATPLKLETVSSQKLVPKKNEKGEVVTRNGHPVMIKVFDGYSKLVMLTNPSNDGSFFREILHISQIEEMTSLGFWSPLKYDIQPFDPHALELNSSGSEYSEKSVKTAYETNQVHGRIIGALNYYRDRRHCLVFVPSVEEAERVAAEYPGAVALSAKTTKKERERIIAEFRAGGIRVLVNVNVLATGFDYTGIDCIILASSTTSIARYYQIVGRGVRIDPAKQDCLVIDIGGNVARFGHIEDIRFEYDGIWRMYGTGGRLLSGIPIECIGCYHREDVQRMMRRQNRCNSLPFGKYKGQPIGTVPLGYLRWLLRSRAHNGDPRDVEMLDRIRLLLENDIRDTTKEPPLVVMPHGIYQEMLLSDIPKNYLWWLYRNTKWTPMNDSLKRGVEFALNSGQLFE